MHYAEYGTGTPVLVLHCAGVDHREIAGALEPMFSTVPGFRRLYPDLPGMGRTPAPETIAGNDDVLDLLLGLIDSTMPKHEVLVSADLGGELGPELEASYRSYFVVQSAETLRRFQELVAPAASLVDESGLMRIFSHWELRDRLEAAKTYPHPVLILAGRQDATAGHTGPWELIEHYPRSTFAVLDRAGHALLHEQPALTHALVVEWLARVREHFTT